MPRPERGCSLCRSLLASCCSYWLSSRYTYVDWCHAYKAGRALDEWRVAIVRAGWCEAAGEVLPRRA